jgi:hypothetical protein
MNEISVLSLDSGDYIITQASLIEPGPDIASLIPDKGNPFIKWITGNFVEADNPNSNGQFWTAGDLEMAEYTIKYAPLNMVHKFWRPVGFFLGTERTTLNRQEQAASGDNLVIRTLSGIWSHLFPAEAAMVENANETQTLALSMECRGTHLRCTGPTGCGNEYPYADVKTHCAHLTERTSVRHIVNPTFRGGALIVPPVQPGWKNAKAEILREVSSYAAQSEAMYQIASPDGSLTITAWEQIMAMLQTSRRTR